MQPEFLQSTSNLTCSVTYLKHHLVGMEVNKTGRTEQNSSEDA